jgi:hypothetical protein
MDTEFSGNFNLLAEEVQLLHDRSIDMDTLRQMHDLLDTHTILLRQHAREIDHLKKAN